MRLLLQTQYTGSCDDASDMTHVLVELDPRELLDMRAKLADILALPDIYSVTFFDWSPQPVSMDIDVDVPAGFDEDEEVITIPNDYAPSESELQIAAPTVRFKPDGLMWCFYEKHSGASYETATILWDFIKVAAKEIGDPPAKILR